MIDILDRLQNTRGQDRKIDVEILTSHFGYRDIHGDGVMFESPGPAGWYYSLEGDEKNQALPSPTCSLDDARELIPEGWTKWWHVGRGLAGVYGATLRRYHDGKPGEMTYDEVGHSAYTAAAALVGAALKAASYEQSNKLLSEQVVT